jgi:8-oxo-dGTP diphosphatase
MPDSRSYPERPILAVSAAIFRDGKVLIIRRGRPPGKGIYTLPGGVVETGEALMDAAVREVREETGLEIEPVALAGHREVIVRDPGGRAARHFVVMCFAARWLSGEPGTSEEIAEAGWRDPSSLGGLSTTEGLAEIIADAEAIIAARKS